MSDEGPHAEMDAAPARPVPDPPKEWDERDLLTALSLLGYEPHRDDPYWVVFFLRHPRVIESALSQKLYADGAAMLKARGW